MAMESIEASRSSMRGLSLLSVQEATHTDDSLQVMGFRSTGNCRARSRGPDVRIVTPVSTDDGEPKAPASLPTFSEMDPSLPCPLVQPWIVPTMGIVPGCHRSPRAQKRSGCWPTCRPRGQHARAGFSGLRLPRGGLGLPHRDRGDEQGRQARRHGMTGGAQHRLQMQRLRLPRLENPLPSAGGVSQGTPW